MKNLKIAIALLATMLVSGVTYAGDLTVTGTARASLNTGGSDSTTGVSEAGGKSLAIENEFVFKAAGELDNGTTWAYSVQLDQGEIDDSAITLTNGYGTIGLFGQAGGLNFKHGGSQMAIGYGSQIGEDTIIDPYDIGGLNNIQYHSPAGLLPFGTVIKAAISMAGNDTSKPGDSVVANGEAASRNAKNYSIETAPLDGLKLGASWYEETAQSTDTDGGQQKQAGAAYISYAMGNWGFGASKGFAAPARAQTATTGINQYETTSYSVGVKVNDNLSLSYGVEKSIANQTTNATASVEAEIDTIQAAYTMGGMTLAAAIKSIDNVDYNDLADQTEAHLIMTLAF
jgi:hypothetical protein